MFPEIAHNSINELLQKAFISEDVGSDFPDFKFIKMIDFKVFADFLQKIGLPKSTLPSNNYEMVLTSDVFGNIIIHDYFILILKFTINFELFLLVILLHEVIEIEFNFGL